MSFWQTRKTSEHFQEFAVKCTVQPISSLLSVPSIYTMAAMPASNPEHKTREAERVVLRTHASFLSFRLLGDPLKLTECVPIFLGKRVYSLPLNFNVGHGDGG